MAGKLSFSIALNLMIDKFRQNSNRVKAEFNAMRMRALTFIAALGAGGWSLENFVSRMRETARETDRVTTALRNVSGTAAAYANNQRWLLGIAKKYGVEINGLTASYAQFNAAAEQQNMSMANRRKVFEAVSRATQAFGLSADDSKGAMLALSQMMSKGKISSEELRLQMGERLPVALAAMAKAAGVPVSKLDDLLKRGKLLSADVLPKFADALNEMVQIKGTDSTAALENRLSNAFTKFTKGSGFNEFYKSAIKGLTDKVDWAADHIKEVSTQLVAVLTGVIFARLFKYLKQQWNTSAEIARSAAEKVAKSARQPFNEMEWRSRRTAETMQAVFRRSAAAVKTAFVSMLPAMVIMGVSTLVARLINVRKEAKRIKNLFAEYQRGAVDARNPAEAIELEKLRALLKDANSSYEQRKNIVDQLNKALNSNFSVEKGSLKINGDINGAIEDRIQLLKDEAELEYQIARNQEAKHRIPDLEHRQVELEGGKRWYSKIFGNTNITWVIDKIRGLENIPLELAEQRKILSESDKAITALLKRRPSNASTPTTPSNEPEENKKLQKAEEDYAEQKEMYARQLAEGLIKEKEYQKLIDTLNKETAKKLAGLLTENELKTNKTYLAAKQGVENPLRGKTADLMDGYEADTKSLAAQRAQNVISEKEYRQALINLVSKTLIAAASLSDIDAAGLAFIEALKTSQTELLAEVKLPEVEPRDTTFDYRLTRPERIAADKAKKEEYAGALKSEIGRDADDLARDIKAAEMTLDELKAKYNAVAPQLVEALNTAMQDVTSLGDALKLAEVQQDIKDLGKEINRETYAGVKEAASSLDRLVNSFSNIQDATTAWERLLAIFNSLTQTADSILSVMDAVERITELTDRLSAAKQAEAAISTTVATTGVANAAAMAAADTARSVEQVAASKAVTGAYQAEMAAKTAAAYAAIPFAGPGIATAQISAMLAIIRASSLPMFANGGIVQGPQSGDKVLARLNGGEMVLNKGQQSTLFSLLRTGGGAPGGEVVFRITGEQLVGVINKYNRRQSRIR